jgi:hypothetical protein
VKIRFRIKLSKGYSRANLTIASTRQKYPFLASTRIRQNGLFQKYARLAKLADVRQIVLRGLAKLADIRQAIWQVLTRLADIC